MNEHGAPSGVAGAQEARFQEARFKDAILAEQLRVLTRRRVDLYVNLVLAGVVALTVRRLFPAWVPPLWLGLLIAALLVRYRLKRRYEDGAADNRTARRRAAHFVAASVATGCIWGLAAAAVMLITAAPAYQLFMIFALGGVTVGGIMLNAGYPPAMLGFMGSAIAPTVAALFFHADPLRMTMGVMVTVFVIAMANAGRGIHRSLVEGVRLRLDQEALVVQLAASEASMAQAQSIACLGSWTFDRRTDRWLWSAELLRIFGLDAGKARSWHEALTMRAHPDDLEDVEKACAAVLAGGKLSEIDYRIVTADGAVRWVHAVCESTFDAGGRIVRQQGMVQDITQRKAGEAELEFANVVLKTQLDASPIAKVLVDRNHRVMSYNLPFAEMWGLPTDVLSSGEQGTITKTVAGRLKAPDAFLERARRLVDNPELDARDDLETLDGRIIERYSASLRTPSNAYLGRLWFFEDVTDRKQALAQALRQARFDSLTGLANRGAFVEAVAEAIDRARQGGDLFAVLYLDLDRFKDINDTLGHPIGDEMLVAVAERLRASAREGDTVARFGGDEFALITSGIAGASDAEILAEALIRVTSGPFLVGENHIHIGASVGIHVYRPGDRDPETVLSYADLALYQAKAEGRGLYRFFTDAMETEARARVTLGSELREAIAADQLFLQYQPQVALADGTITGLEALVRWRHPKRGVLGPDAFIPLAEQTGLIGALGHWVLWAACRQSRAWMDEGLDLPRMCVNVSALQFKAFLALEADIAAALAETGLPPERLELELTETVMMSASREHGDVLGRIGESGVTVAIDDFGTGYSSLDYLRRFPTDRIKIAHTFVRQLKAVGGDAAIVKATLGLARELGIAVIAEGVETLEQLLLLRGWGCAEGQGFYFARPLDAEAIPSLLRQGGHWREPCMTTPGDLVLHGVIGPGAGPG